MMFDPLHLDEDEYCIIPMNWAATRYYTFTFEGWGHFTLDVNDETMNIIIRMARKTLNSFMEIYKETHVFTQPILAVKPNGTFSVKIGTLTKEDYMERIEKDE